MISNFANNANCTGNPSTNNTCTYFTCLGGVCSAANYNDSRTCSAGKLLCIFIYLHFYLLWTVADLHHFSLFSQHPLAPYISARPVAVFQSHRTLGQLAPTPLPGVMAVYLPLGSVQGRHAHPETNQAGQPAPMA